MNRASRCPCSEHGVLKTDPVEFYLQKCLLVSKAHSICFLRNSIKQAGAYDASMSLMRTVMTRSGQTEKNKPLCGTIAY